MFYKLIVNNVPRLYNISKLSKVEIINNTIYLYYYYPRTLGNGLFFTTILEKEHDKIQFESDEEAKQHFENIEKLLK